MDYIAHRFISLMFSFFTFFYFHMFIVRLKSHHPNFQNIALLLWYDTRGILTLAFPFLNDNFAHNILHFHDEEFRLYTFLKLDLPFFVFESFYLTHVTKRNDCTKTSWYKLASIVILQIIAFRIIKIVFCLFLTYF